MPELLADHTTLRVGGPAAHWVRARTDDEIVEALTADPGALVVGGGSNLVVGDDGVGAVVEIATSGLAADHDDPDPTCGGVVVTVAAGQEWDPFVATAVDRGWVGVEALAGIPGRVGATPVQNVGAYGQEVAQTIARVTTWDRVDAARRTFAAADCGFGYRTSRFKSEPGRYVVLSVAFHLRQGRLGAPVQYAELARALGVEVGARVPATDVRAAVLELRRGKGMVLDGADHDTWSAGSFFTNPLVAPTAVPDGAPAWPQPDGRVKTSAAWLIQHAGFDRGYGAGPARLSTKHTLALTNRGGATTADLLALAREVRDGVQGSFGIRLQPEPVLVGCAL